MPIDGNLPSCQSDHRMIWIKTDNMSVLGKELPHKELSRDSARVKSNDPRCRKAFNRLVKQKYAENDIFCFAWELRSDAVYLQGCSSIAKPRKLQKFKRKF